MPASRAHSFASIAVRVLVVAAVAAATPLPVPAQAQPAQRVTVTIKHAQPAYSPDTTFTVDVAVNVARPAEYLEVRLRLTSPSGRLLYQKTEVRHGIDAGVTGITFQRPFRGLGVREGRYPLEIRVLATGSEPVIVKSRLLILDLAGRAPVPVAIVAHLTSPPAVDPSGRFATDPQLYPRPRSDAERILDAANRHPASSLSLAIPPILIEEWLRASGGYEVLDPAGIRPVPAEDPTAIACGAVVRRLREAVGSKRIELLDIPYAEPDLARLNEIRALDDLERHWSLTDAVILRAVGSAPASGTVFTGIPLPPRALEAARVRGASFVITAPGALLSHEATAPPGLYRLAGGVTGVVPDRSLADAAEADDAEAFYDVLFERAVSSQPTAPLVAMFDLGPGSPHTALAVERALTWLDTVQWAASASMGAALRAIGTLPEAAPATAAPPPAPPGYWAEVAHARMYAIAAEQALGAADGSGRAIRTSSLIAESRLWAGPDGSYALADRGIAFARWAVAAAERLFDEVSIAGSNVTLPDVSGEIPVSITNRSGKTLAVTLRARAKRASIHGMPHEISLQPGENVVSIPVDMRNQVEDHVEVSVTSGDVVLASTRVAVRASYLDRIVTIAGVVLFLLGLLAFIRQRARRADAATIASDVPPSNGS